jgi:hypothetical protein
MSLVYTIQSCRGEAAVAQAADKIFRAVILSEAKNLALRIFTNGARFFVACGSSEWQSRRASLAGCPSSSNLTWNPRGFIAHQSL